jgi:hypothetical protein
MSGTWLNTQPELNCMNIEESTEIDLATKELEVEGMLAMERCPQQVHRRAIRPTVSLSGIKQIRRQNTSN